MPQFQLNVGGFYEDPTDNTVYGITKAAVRTLATAVNNVFHGQFPQDGLTTEQYGQIAEMLAQFAKTLQTNPFPDTGDMYGIIHEFRIGEAELSVVIAKPKPDRKLVVFADKEEVKVIARHAVAFDGQNVRKNK